MSTPRPDPRYSSDAVAAMHRAFMARIEQEAQAAIAQTGQIHLQQDLTTYLLAAERKRIKIPSAKVLDLANTDEHTIRAEQEEIESAAYFTPEQQAKLDAATRQRVQHDVLDAVFGDDDRIYLQTLYPDDMGPTESAIRTHLQRHGYHVTDYIGGYATDTAGKNTYRIGKLLASNNAMKFPYEGYKQDTSRIKDTMVVISRRPEDIARMSAGRHWGSCMSPHRAEFNAFAHRDIEHGTIVAYLVRTRDPEINDPLSRLLIKPYQDRPHNLALIATPLDGLGHDIHALRPIRTLFNRLFARKPPVPDIAPVPAVQTIFVPEGKVHGGRSPELRATVDRFVATHLNRNAPDGAYYLSPQLYCDSNSSREYAKKGDLLRPVKSYDSNPLPLDY